MTFADKLMTERKKLGMSQEQLADRLGVTRQSVSKWESGASVPELNKIVQLSELFQVSVDYLVKDNLAEDPLKQKTNWENMGDVSGYGKTVVDSTRLEEKVDDLASYLKGYSYTSKIKIAGIPLVSIRFSRHAVKGGVAKGIIAIGNVAVGVVSIGAISVGVLSLGALSAGLLALGAVAFGAMALGAVAIGYLALGCVALGIYAGGVVATGLKLAVGMTATGKTAIGEVVNGENTLKVVSGMSFDAVKNFILQNCPGIWEFIANLFAAMGAST